MPEGLGPRRDATPLTHGEAGKYDADAAPGRRPYIVTQFVGAVLLTVGLLFLAEDLRRFEQIGLALLIAWTVTNVGGLVERRGWAVVSELGRLGALWGVAIFAATRLEPGGAAVLVSGGALLAGGFASWLLRPGWGVRGATSGGAAESG